MIDGIGIEGELHRRVSQKATLQPADALADKVSSLTADAEKDMQDSAFREQNASELGESGPTLDSTIGNDESGEISNTPETQRDGGLSIGLSPSAKEDAAADLVAETPDQTELDQS